METSLANDLAEYPSCVCCSIEPVTVYIDYCILKRSILSKSMITKKAVVSGIAGRKTVVTGPAAGFIKSAKKPFLKVIFSKKVYRLCGI